MIVTQPTAFTVFIIAGLLAIVEGGFLGWSIAGIAIGSALTLITRK